MNIFYLLLHFIAFSCSSEVTYLQSRNGVFGLNNVWRTGPNVIACGNSWNYITFPGMPKFWSTCVTDAPNQGCFLMTEFYPTNSINMVFLNITTSVKLCKSFTVKKCVETYELRADIGPERSGNVFDNRYKFITNIPGGRSNVTKNIFLYNELIPIDGLTGKSGITLAFYTSQFCGGLIQADLLYYTCPAESDELITFKAEPAPSKKNSSSKIKGVCAANAAKQGQIEPYMICHYNGSTKVYGKCVCEKGYTKKDTKCDVCDDISYKPSIGNQVCFHCGINSNSIGNPKISCVCLDDFFKVLNESNKVNADCYRPPSSPKAIKQTVVNSTSATITWNEPDHPGSNSDGTYKIECLNCPPDRAEFPLNTTKTRIVCSGLGSYAQYRIKISKHNNITQLTGKTFSTSYLFRTLEGIPGKIRNVKYTTNSDGSVTLTWKAPFAEGGPNPVYIIKYGDNKKKTTKETYTIGTSTQDNSYTVKIYVEVEVNGKKVSGSTHEEKVRIKGDISLPLLIVPAVVVLVVVVTVMLVAFYIWRRKNPPYWKVVRHENGKVELPKRFNFAGKIYVDPTAYGAVDEAVQEFANELDKKNLQIGQMLGGGEFAEVYKGTLIKNGKSNEVAIKTLKHGASKGDRDDFLGEAAILGQFHDSNVICMEGVVLKEYPNVIVLEFMVNGALDKYLQANDMQFTILQLLGMARGVSSGMKYLSEMGFIHRDLAARNILVDEYKVCKVADFGMSREIKVDDTYDTKGGKIPVRWTAPEAIQFKKFTNASDIWSYGVLLWEIISYGERPYWDWGNYEVLERINAGYRLPPPMSCPKVIHDLMLHCWARDRTKRPKFSAIRDLLEKWIRNPELLKEIASVVEKRDEHLDYTSLQTISKWLDAIGMIRYAGNFIDQGFATPRQILDLSMEDLEALSIIPIGHRKKIHKAIQNTRMQVEARSGSVSRSKSLSRK